MSLVLGATKSGKPLVLSREERSRHMHIIGSSGAGKSKFMEALLRQDVRAGRGFCLIDPHGTLSTDLIQWCAATGMHDFRRIHIIEPSELSYALGFNPLRQDGSTETELRVDFMVSACAQVWGGEDSFATPLLKKCLRAVFYALCIRNLTLVEAPLLTTSADVQLRRQLTGGLPDYVFDTLWRDLEGLTRREFFEQFSSTNNRLLEFLSAPVVRRMLGQRERALDLQSVMDNGEILIVNLKAGGALSSDNARLIGTLLTSELFLLALTRSPDMAKRRPFTLFIDECYDYLTSDIERMLDQTRKFGLHVVLAHQRLGQLRDRSESIFNGVMAGGQTKVVFGGLTDEDADLMAREIMRSSINLERPKHILDKLTVVDEVPYWLESESWSETRGDTRTEGRSTSWSESEGTADGVSRSFDQTGRTALGSALSEGASWGRGHGASQAQSISQTTSESVSRGRAQTLKPVRELLPTAVHSLEEEFHLAMVRLRELPKAAAIVKRPGKLPARISTTRMKPALAAAKRIDRFVQTTRARSPYLSERDDADAEIYARQHALGARRAVETPEFWTEEP